MGARASTFIFLICCLSKRLNSLINKTHTSLTSKTGLINMKTPLNLEGNHILIPVRINESKENYYFHLDTGAQITVIMRELANKLNIPINKEKAIKAKTAAGEIDIQLGFLESFTIGSISVSNLEVIISDMKKHDPNIEIHGTIGHNFLMNYQVRINYPEATLELIGKEDKLVESVDLNPIVYFKNSNLILLETKINDKGPYWFILDTGASGNVFSASLINELKVTPRETDKKVFSPSGFIPVKEVTIKKLETKYNTLLDTDFMLIDLDHLNEEGDKKIAGILGYPFLKDFEVILDYPKQKIALSKK